ncbi:YqcC family protein [Psychrobium sp. 1_MG-2023]|uniref:YqcC family protein n=1 Tax=Psychrobium sp. 1_MG-2023 TaxID=3062624 RepID=UPI000C346525|nr:YqcC family protein [Psychrobium sp. 1_MG-2023]MDP2560529.1 YqcC family protein [Psychrobium sp. 1_MG-2023]PKF57520.1 hypothetical protein CW748_06405 [Alteromonadales bacterium alter-6D02]
MSDAQQVSVLLEQINQEMVRIDLWQSTSPDKAALESSEPFCCDTLTFAQWLEFILLPKMQMLIDSNMPLPTEFLILPMAEESFKGVAQNTTPLLKLIAELDAQFNATIN